MRYPARYADARGTYRLFSRLEEAIVHPHHALDTADGTGSPFLDEWIARAW